jgi:hypothetical protein
MKISNENKAQIEELGGCFFTPEDIAIILQLDLTEFNGVRFQEDDFRIPYQRGKLLKEAEIRKAILKMAVAGSSPAQMLAKELIDKSVLAAISI